ncbi:porin [Massilia sp. PWRC2]|uniref:porin n=1 Tax=Massilia sp. PWRC2 TaxID=2804626 RepID=UPI003CF02657
MHTITFSTRKTVLAAAVLTSLASLAGLVQAQSLPVATSVGGLRVDTSIYGFLNGQLESVEATGGATPYSARGRVSDGNSRIGFRGNISVDADLKGIWQIEAAMNNFDQGGVNSRGESATLSSRNTYVGIESVRFGTFLVGNNDSVYRSLVGSGGALGGNLGLTTHGLDVWNNTSAQVSGNADSAFSRGEARYKNSAHYLSPVWYGVQVGGSYGFDEEQASNTNRSRYALAIKYSVGPFAIGAGFDRQNNTGVDTSRLINGFGFRTTDVDGAKTDFMKVLGTYRLPSNTTLGLGFEQAKYGFQSVTVPTPGNFYVGTIDGRVKQNSVMGSLTQEFGAATLMASYAKLGELKNTTFASPGDFGAKQWSVGATYALNRFLTPYVYFTKIRNSTQQSINLGQAPVYSNNSGTENAYLAPGDSPRAFGIGMIARF